MSIHTHHVLVAHPSSMTSQSILFLVPSKHDVWKVVLVVAAGKMKG